MTPRLWSCVILACLCFTAPAVRAEDEALPALVELLSTNDDPQFQIDLLRGMKEGLGGRRNVKMPAGWETLAAKLLKSPVAQVRELAQTLSVTFGSATALDAFKQTLADAKTDPKTRLAALERLLAAKDPTITGIVVGGESAQRAGAPDFVLEQGLEDAGDGGVFRGEEAFEGEEAGLRIGLRIGERFLEGVESLRAAEGDGEGLGKFAHLRIGTLEQLGGEGFPAGGHLHITPSAEAFLHAAEKIDLELRVVIGGEQFHESGQCIVLGANGGRGEA